MSSTFLIVGAGAAGLSTAYALSLAGKRVVVLEARDRIGGRAFTDTVPGFDKPVERGAEFIHGQLPITLSLLKEAGLPYHKTGGRMHTFRNGRQEDGNDLFEHWEELLEKMNALETDEALGSFLERAFSGGDWEEFRAMIRNYAEGYDAADADRISVFAVREEWGHEGDDHQYRIDGGYAGLMNWLAEKVEAAGGAIHLNAVVSHISWDKTGVKIACKSGQQYEAGYAILTIPAGVWQAPAGSEGYIRFTPDIPMVAEAFRNIGISGVVKVSLQFEEAFWEKAVLPGAPQYKNLGMLLSDAAMPTWWTQAPENTAMISAWLAGPRAATRKAGSDAELLEEALSSLAYLTGRTISALKSLLQASAVSNWTAEPFSRGAYAWATPQTATARSFLMAGIDDTLFFAGEALYEGTAMGTVEAALYSGREVAAALI